ncbi:MAG: TIM barrel protein [Pseudomonadota bacterium]
MPEPAPGHLPLSANLGAGFLFSDRPLPDAVRAAAAAGFDAVELHWPYDVPIPALKAALDETGLPVIGLNTPRGDVAAGENGLAALPGREAEAAAALEQALTYGAAIGARAVHVMAGFAQGPEAEACFLANLARGAEVAAAHGMTLLIEPLNARDVPGYFLSTATQAEALLTRLGSPHVRMMFDCYHLQIMGGDLTRLFERLGPLVGHIQFAGVPDRAEPDRGEIAYDRLLPVLAAAGHAGPFGAEYRPRGRTEDGLAWMRAFRPRM